MDVSKVARRTVGGDTLYRKQDSIMPMNFGNEFGYSTNDYELLTQKTTEKDKLTGSDDYIGPNDEQGAELGHKRCLVSANNENPALERRPVSMRTSDFYKTRNLPERFDKPELFRGYGPRINSCQHPMYRRSSDAYGEYPPNVHTMPVTYHGRSQKFSLHLGTCGMYRNHSLNTSLDKSKV